MANLKCGEILVVSSPVHPRYNDQRLCYTNSLWSLNPTHEPRLEIGHSWKSCWHWQDLRVQLDGKGPQSEKASSCHCKSFLRVATPPGYLDFPRGMDLLLSLPRTMSSPVVQGKDGETFSSKPYITERVIRVVPKPTISWALLRIRQWPFCSRSPRAWRTLRICIGSTHGWDEFPQPSRTRQQQPEYHIVYIVTYHVSVDKKCIMKCRSGQR